MTALGGRRFFHDATSLRVAIKRIGALDRFEAVDAYQVPDGQSAAKRSERRRCIVLLGTRKGLPVALSQLGQAAAYETLSMRSDNVQLPHVAVIDEVQCGSAFDRVHVRRGEHHQPNSDFMVMRDRVGSAVGGVFLLAIYLWYIYSNLVLVVGRRGRAGNIRIYSIVNIWANSA
jgi:hypothetical protein